MVYKKPARHLSEMVADEETFSEPPEIKDYAYAEAPKGGQGSKAVIIILTLLIIVVGSWYVLSKFTSLPVPNFGNTPVNASNSTWQAVFLSNDQVYFGKIKQVTKDYLVLREIYYLQVVTEPLQRSQEGESATTGDSNQTEQQLKLIKLGDELHGPTDEMVINCDQIVLTEKLKPESQVVKAINSYLEEQAKSSQKQTSAPTQ